MSERKGWQIGVAGNANVVSFDGSDIVGIARVSNKEHRRLIAAAPDLLEACELALYQVDDTETYVAIEAAIAKAEPRRMMRELQKQLFDQAKKCRTVNGASLLLSIKSCLDGGSTVFGGLSELHEAADLLAGPMWHDKPTGPGRWMWGDTGQSFEIGEPVDPDDYAEGRYFGPIPEDCPGESVRGKS